MADDSEWAELLEACCGPVPQAWTAGGALVQANVEADWQLPPVAAGSAYKNYSIHRSDLGHVDLLKWRARGETLPHSWPGRRVFHCLVRGRLHQRSWTWHNGLLIPTGERRVKGPDVLASGPEDCHSYLCPEGAITLTVYTTGGAELHVVDVANESTTVLKATACPREPLDADSIVSRDPWA